MIAALKDSDNVVLKLVRAVILLVLMAALTFGVTMTAFADEDSTDNDFSFYKVSSAATSYYDEAHNPSSDYDFAYSGISMDKAGAFVGFIDEDYDSGLIGSTVSFLSGSSQSRSYDTFTSEQGLQEYVLYGHALASLGLDSTANETFDILSIARFLGGLVLILFYTTALSADALFAGVIAILQTFNPFAWFMAGVNNVSTSFAEWFDTTPQVPALFDGLSQFITGWYDAASNLGMYLVFLLFFLSLGVTLLLWKSRANRVGGVFRTFFTRLAFICIGIPLLGGLYTASLDLAAESSWGRNFTPAANQVIAATLVDFEGWVTNNSLALPYGVTITVDTDDSAAGVVDAGSSTSVRGIARAINSSNSSLGGSASDKSWNLTLKSGYQSNNSVLGAYDVMGRYMSSAFYHASDYETTYKADIADDSNATDIYNGIKDKSGKKDEYKDTGSNMFDNAEGSTGRTTTPYFNDGSKESFKPDINGDIVTFSRSGSTDDNTDAGGMGRGLSSMSMYNYLTTSFGDSSVVTYSTHKATSGLVVQAHHSVNLIGDGMTAVLYWANACIILFVITIIGLVYSVGLIINMLGRGIKMVSSVPFAVLGNMKAMAKVVTYTAMMIIEVLGTFFVYSLVIEILLSLSGLVETPMLELLSDSVGSTVLMNGTVVPGATAAIPTVASNALVVVGVLLSCIIYLWFGIKAIKLRKAIIKTIDDAVAGTIDRLFTTDPQGGSMSNAQGAGRNIVNAPTLGDKAKNAASSIAGGVAGGVGMALGQKAVSDLVGKKDTVAGSIAEGAAGGAENAGGTDEDKDTGTGIEGADRQGLPGGPPNGPDGAGGAESEGRRLLSANADSLGDLKAGDAADVPDASQMGAPESQDGQDVRDISAAADVSTREVQEQADGASAETKPLEKGEAVAKGDVDSITGKTSAMEEEQDREEANERRKDGVKNVVAGGAQTAKGVAEGVAAYYTGDAEMAKNAAQDVAEGAGKAGEGAKEVKNAAADVKAERAQVNEGKPAQPGQGGSSTVVAGTPGTTGQSGKSDARSTKAAQSGAQQGGMAAQKGANAAQKVAGAQKGAAPAGAGSSTVIASGSSTVHGGSATMVSHGGATNVAVSNSAMSPQDRQKLNSLKNNERALERAREQVRRTGSATLPGGRIVHNTADVSDMLRKNRAEQSRITQASASKATSAASKGTQGTTRVSGVKGASSQAPKAPKSLGGGKPPLPK